VTAVKLLEGADYAFGRVQQPFAVRVVADIGDQRADGSLRLVPRRPVGDRLRRGADVLRKRRLRVGWRALGPGLDDGVHRSRRSPGASAVRRAPDVSPGGRVADPCLDLA